MSFEVHPGSDAGPAALAPGPGTLVEFDDHSAVDGETGRNMMFVRVVQIDEGDGRTAPRPSISLSVGGGPATKITSSNTPIAVRPGGEPVALATLLDDPDDIQLVEIEVVGAIPQWRIQLSNNDSQSRRYIWIVASTIGETARPWLDAVVAAPLRFDALTGQAAQPRQLTIANYGTTTLRINTADAADLGSGFTLLDITPRPLGANRRGTARFGFTAPINPGTFTAVLDIASNDAAAGSVAGHNDRVTLSANVIPRPLWDPGELLVVTNDGPNKNLCRLDRAASRLVQVVADLGDIRGMAVDPSTGDVIALYSDTVRRFDRLTGNRRVLLTRQPLEKGLVGPAVTANGTVLVFNHNVSRNGAVLDSELWVIPAQGDPQFKTQVRTPHVWDLGDELKAIAATPSGDMIGVVNGFRLIQIPTVTPPPIDPAQPHTIRTFMRLAPFQPGDGFAVTAFGPGADGSVVVAKTGTFPGAGSPITVNTAEHIDLGTGARVSARLDAQFPPSVTATSDGTIVVLESTCIKAYPPGAAMAVLVDVGNAARVLAVPGSGG